MPNIRTEMSRSYPLILAGMWLILNPSFGQRRMQARPASPLAVRKTSLHLTGTYTRIKRLKDENQSAVLVVKQTNAERIHFHLTALWWPVGREDSAHNGEIEATVALHNHVAVYNNGDYCLSMRFADHMVVLTERGSSPEFGLNVSAAGTYRRTSRSTSLK